MTEYIYYLIDPIDKKVRYVGKTKNPERRYKQHIKKLDRQMTLKRQWLENLHSKNLEPIMKVVERVEEEEEGKGREREQYHVTLNIDTIFNIHNPGKGIKSIKGRYPKREKQL